MAERKYLTSAVITATSKKVPIAPVEDVHLLIPSMNDSVECGFTWICVKKESGEIEWSTDDRKCDVTAVPILYASLEESFEYGDMELEELEGAPEGIRVWKTRPFPDKRNLSLVLLSGVIEKGEGDVIFQLPEGFRPGQKVVSVISNSGDYVEISPDTGNVTLISRTENSDGKMCLDNVRFLTSSVVGSCVEIRPRLAFRSVVYALQTAGKVEIGGNYRDMFIPVTVVGENGPELSVIVLTRDGRVVPLSELKLTGPVFVSSCMTGPAAPEEWLSPENWPEHFKALVGLKLRALTYSRLSGEDEFECIRNLR